jgi:hypothetical protein
MVHGSASMDAARLANKDLVNSRNAQETEGLLTKASRMETIEVWYEDTGGQHE